MKEKKELNSLALCFSFILHPPSFILHASSLLFTPCSSFHQRRANHSADKKSGMMKASGHHVRNSNVWLTVPLLDEAEDSRSARASIPSEAMRSPPVSRAARRSVSKAAPLSSTCGSTTAKYFSTLPSFPPAA